MSTRADEHPAAEAAAEVIRVAGPVVVARSSRSIRVRDEVAVGAMRLVGEAVALRGDEVTIQVYEDTSGLRPGDPVFGTDRPLSVELGPGLIGVVFDGLERPLEKIARVSGAFIGRGVSVPPLDQEKPWHFVPAVRKGDRVSPGAIIGTVRETVAVEHRILAPSWVSGRVDMIVPEGERTLRDVVCRLIGDGGEPVELGLSHRWPVRVGRPYVKKLAPEAPLFTGQRILDLFFPLARGGTAAIPGGFGTGKTVIQHQLAKWCDADIIVYVGCGERGNEMTQVLQEFPELVDPRTGRPLMERTVLIANTSNMPVTARESSVYTGMTIAEYFRDMGYNVAMMADSTSRWAEALRELSGRLEEMPAEEGFPAYLPTRLAEFYERAGRVEALSGREGSVTVVGAVSPPGGDFSEPVTMNTKRFIRVFWALDKDLAGARHFPAISWLDSYSADAEVVAHHWGARRGRSWSEMRTEALAILVEEDRLQRIARLVGKDALPEAERLVLETARLIREGLLQQAAFDPVDTYCPREKQLAMLEIVLHFHERAKALIQAGCPMIRLQGLGAIEEMLRMKSEVPNDRLDLLDAVRSRLDEEMTRLEKDYR